MTLEEVMQRLIDAMALEPEERHRWLEHAEHRLYSARAKAQPWVRMYDVSTVGMRLRTAREVCGMSIRQCAIRARIHEVTLGNVERGRQNLSVERLPTLCRVLGVSPKWVLEGGDEGGPPVPHAQLRKRVTQRWRERQDLLRAREKARKEAERLNAYARKLREGQK